MSWRHAVICCDEGREWALTTHQWATLVYLALMANMETSECRPTMERIAGATKQTKKSARAKVAELEEMGYLSVVRKAGNGGRNTYKVLVDNFVKGEHGDPLEEESKGNVATPLRGTPQPLKGECGDPFEGDESEKPKGNATTPLGGTIGGDKGLKGRKVSKLVGMAPRRKQVVNNVGKPVDKSDGKAGGKQAAEELLDQPKKSVLEIAPSARYDAKKILHSIADRRSDEEYQALMREPGWKPTTRADRLACNMRCYALGASHEQAAKFISYNAVHRWAACDMASINDLAQMWVDSWKRTSPDEWRAEQARRRYEESSRMID